MKYSRDNPASPKFISGPRARESALLSHLRAISCVRMPLREVFPLWSGALLLSRLSPLCRVSLFTRTSKRNVEHGGFSLSRFPDRWIFEDTMYVNRFYERIPLPCHLRPKLFNQLAISSEWTFLKNVSQKCHNLFYLYLYYLYFIFIIIYLEQENLNSEEILYVED